jgi:glycosyltransferase involved in cell wall biosynthesis
MVPASASVVIPSYNMAWCLSRAIKSCQAQSPATLDEIVVVDDCSTDETESLVRQLQTQDQRIKYIRRAENGGHLASLATGVHHAKTHWIALLDADDELRSDSLENRITAARNYYEANSILSQLVYGDLDVMRFTRLEGYVFPFVCKELCLCQTSTIMLGKAALSYFPMTENWNTDDEIVLSIPKHFHVLHCGQVVTRYHRHADPSRMSNNKKKVFQWVYQLVRDHRNDIVRIHGIRRLILWYIRVLRAFLNYQISVSGEIVARTESGPVYAALRAYGKCLSQARGLLDVCLKTRFDLHYF